MNVPTLILHGDDDQIVPIADSALLSAKLVKGAILKVYKGAPHGMCTTHKDQVNEDLLTFLKGEGRASSSILRWCRCRQPIPTYRPTLSFNRFASTHLV